MKLPPIKASNSMLYPDVDQVLLYEVLRVYLESEEKIREYATCSSFSMEVGVMEDDRAIENQLDNPWAIQALGAEKPFYGFDEVLHRIAQCKKDMMTKTPVMSTMETKRARVYQNNRRKCWTCKSRLSLAPISCKCGYAFCPSHRYPERHACTFDYKRDGKRKIEMLNPPYRSSKMIRL